MNRGSRSSYVRGVRLMALVVLPLSLLAAAIMISLDPEESASLGNVIANNAIPLYAFGLVPAVLFSMLHSRAMSNLGDQKRSHLRLYSAGLGLVGGIAISLLLSLILFRTVSTTLWLLWVWGISVGGLYGFLQGRGISE